MDFTTEQLIEQYIKLRDAKGVIAAETVTKLEPIAAAMDAIEASLLDEMNKSGETSKKTKAGTAFIKLNEFVGIADWDQVIKFIEDTGSTNMLKKDVNKTAILEYIKEHKVPPPGVNYTAKREVQIRKPA